MQKKKREKKEQESMSQRVLELSHSALLPIALTFQ